MMPIDKDFQNLTNKGIYMYIHRDIIRQYKIDI